MAGIARTTGNMERVKCGRNWIQLRNVMISGISGATKTVKITYVMRITMNKVWIGVEVDGFPGFTMIVDVPKNVDEEEYIDDLLEGILQEGIWENTVWDFV